MTSCVHCAFNQRPVKDLVFLKSSEHTPRSDLLHTHLSSDRYKDRFPGPVGLRLQLRFLLTVSIHTTHAHQIFMHIRYSCISLKHTTRTSISRPALALHLHSHSPTICARVVWQWQHVWVHTVTTCVCRHVFRLRTRCFLG